MRKLIVVLLCALVIQISQADITVTNYPDSDSTQIWIAASDFDDKTAQFAEDTSVTGTLSGHAYYFEDYDGPTTYQPWWAEYSIDQSLFPQVVLGGKTWYFWARATQPISGAEESDVVFVKGDPGDGSGTDWYTAALSTVSTTDRVLNGLEAAGGVGAWVWCSTQTDPIVSKQFTLDENGKIVFRVSERESGLTNARIDLIMWTDDPAYTPTDADYLGTSVYGVKQVFDGRIPGEIPHLMWRANDASSDDAIIYALNGTDKPVYYYGGGYDLSYTLNMLDHNNDSGSMIDVGKDFVPDYDDDFAVEVWFRADGCTADVQQQVLWSTQTVASNGMRLFIYDWGGASGKFSIGFEARDNAGSGKVIWSINDTNGGAKYEYGQWMQVVAVYNGGAAGDGRPNMKIYTNGQLKTDTNITAAVPSDIDFFTSFCGSFIGSRGIEGVANFKATDRMYFDGGICMFVSYNMAISASQIAASYDNNKDWIVDEKPFDPSIDEPFDDSGVFEISDSLIFKLDARYPGSIPSLACVNEQTNSTGEVKSNGDLASSFIPLHYQGANGAGYEFNCNSSSGGYLNLGNILPDYDEPFTAEVWVRPDAFVTGNLQQVLFTSQALGSNGARLYIADWNLDQKYQVAYEMRDNTGSKAQWNSTAPTLFNCGAWHQILAVYDPNAAGNNRPNIKIYVDGEMKSNVNMTVAAPTDFNFVQDKMIASFGMRGKEGDLDNTATQRHYFDGGLALIRLYNKVFSAVEVQVNYNHDKPWIVDSLPYNPATDTLSVAPAVLPKTEGSLVGEYDGRDAGDHSDVNWSSANGGEAALYSIGTTPRWPQYASDAYYFSSYLADPDSAGGAIKMNDLYVPDYNDDFTVEVWVCPDEITAANQQQVLWGTQGISANGMRLLAWDWNGAWTDYYGIGFELRDNTGQKARYSMYTNTEYQHSSGWKQFVVAYDGADAKKPLFQLYVNGQKRINTSGIVITDPLPSDINFKLANAVQGLGMNGFVTDNSTISKDTRQFYQGGMALVRIYNRTLAGAEILANYNNDSAWVSVLPLYTAVSIDPSLVPEITKADINGNRHIDLDDFAVLAEQWYADPITNIDADITQDNSVNVYDLKKLCEYWLVQF